MAATEGPGWREGGRDGEAGQQQGEEGCTRPIWLWGGGGGGGAGVMDEHAGRMEGGEGGGG